MDIDYLDEPDYIPKKRAEIDIPDFLTKPNVVPTQEMLNAQAVLNNVPDSTENEEINHLNELEQVCKNWSVEEWRRILKHARTKAILEELVRRTEIQEDYILTTRQNMTTLDNLDV